MASNCLVLEDRAYHVHVEHEAANISPQLLAEIRFDQRHIPVTVCQWAEPGSGHQDLESIFTKFSQVDDDVWCTDFTSVLILAQSSGCAHTIEGNHVVRVFQSEINLPSGPYVLDAVTGAIHQISRLHTDTHLAFLHGVVRESKAQGGFHTIAPDLGIPVPSKHYYLDDPRPLAGIRFAVKDTIALQGQVTGFGSAAWLDTYEAETHTAPCIQALLDAGAVLVGKAKSTEFAEGVEPWEWIDSICPYNPRGDGKQKASSSSAGSAVAAAAYKWLDFTVGTDTGGSIRHPAGVQGLYGQRCSSLSADLNGVLGATDLFNTVGVFARDVDIFARAGNHIARLSEPQSGPERYRNFNLLYPTRAAQLTSPDQHHHGQHRWFPNVDVPRSAWTEAEKLIDVIISAIESELACKRYPFNINELWTATPPVGQSRNLDEAVGRIYSTITTSAAVHSRIDRFIDDYSRTHGGAQPRISSLVQQRLHHGRTVTKKQFAKSLEAMQAFARWTETTLFGSHDQEALTLLVFPQSCGRPDYRDDVTACKELFNDTFSIYAFGYLVGSPDYTIPVGEVAFVSKITGKQAYLPVSISLVSPPGTDAELFQVVRRLRESGVVKDVLPGARLYVDDVDSERPR